VQRLSEVASYFTADYGCFAYFEHGSPQSAKKALDHLESYIEAEGPFDGVMAFSQGANLATMLMARQAQQDENLDVATRRDQQPIFKCAIFFSGAVVDDPQALERNEARFLDPIKDGQLIHVPTAHIWGSNDHVFIPQGVGHSFGQLFEAGLQSEFIHEEGHEVPKAKAAVIEAVNAIRRAIGLAI